MTPYAAQIVTLAGLIVFMVVGSYAQYQWMKNQVDRAIQGEIIKDET